VLIKGYRQFVDCIRRKKIGYKNIKSTLESLFVYSMFFQTPFTHCFFFRSLFRESRFTVDLHPFFDLFIFANEMVKKGVGVHSKAVLTTLYQLSFNIIQLHLSYFFSIASNLFLFHSSSSMSFPSLFINYLLISFNYICHISIAGNLFHSSSSMSFPSLFTNYLLISFHYICHIFFHSR